MLDAPVTLRPDLAHKTANAHDAKDCHHAPAAGAVLAQAHVLKVAHRQAAAGIFRVIGVVEIERVNQHLETPRLGHYPVEQQIVREVFQHQRRIARQRFGKLRLLPEGQGALPLCSRHARGHQTVKGSEMGAGEHG